MNKNVSEKMKEMGLEKLRLDLLTNNGFDYSDENHPEMIY